MLCLILFPSFSSNSIAGSIAIVRFVLSVITIASPEETLAFDAERVQAVRKPMAQLLLHSLGLLVGLGLAGLGLGERGLHGPRVPDELVAGALHGRAQPLDPVVVLLAVHGILGLAGPAVPDAPKQMLETAKRAQWWGRRSVRVGSVRGVSCWEDAARPKRTETAAHPLQSHGGEWG